MAGVLNFSQFVGSPDDIIVEQWFPSNRRTLIFNFNQDITDWSFTAEFQTIVVDTVTFNRTTGKPNFAESSVIGSFAPQSLDSFASGVYIPATIDVAAGTVRITHPNGMYTGPILPDARQNVPITVFSLTWTDASSPISNVNTHRYALVNCWEPEVTPGDPTLDGSYTALVVA